MGKVLFLADIHGNMPAVRALEKEIEKIKPDDIWFLGDVVGKGPENDKTVDWIQSHCNHFVKGNWDDSICKTFREKDWPPNLFYCNQLGKERIQWLDSLPFEDEVLISGWWFRLVHGYPSDRRYQAYDNWDELSMGFHSKVSNRIYNAYICADSHMPYFRACNQGYAINTGSVGNSLGIPRVHAVLIEGEIGSEKISPFHCQILSIPYNNQEAADIAKQYPDLPNMEAYQKEVLTGIYSR